MGSVTFILNGEERTAVYSGRETLLKYLRNVECLKGTKEACGMGQCGACSVIIDGKLCRSCVTLLQNMQGRTVETIENVAKNGELSVIQKSFLDAGAVQCGFCTPGMVMATKVLLSGNLNPTEEEICEGLKNNYCRCTGYVKIIEAVKLAAARLRGDECTLQDVRQKEHTEITAGENQEIPPVKGKALGKPVWDVDGPAKVTGSLKFCDDYEAEEFGEEQMLHGAFVWAPAPRAKILSMKTERAEASKGVVRIVTAADVPGSPRPGGL